MAAPVTVEGAIRAIFDAVDADGSGTLDREEVGQLIKKLRPSRGMDIEIQKMDGKDVIGEAMKQMDADGDGSVTFDEFAAWWQDGGSMTRHERAEHRDLRRQRFSKEAAVRKIFDELDVNGDGQLDREEVRLAAVKLGRVLTARQLDLAMKDMDTDNSGKVDFDEFSDYWSCGGQLSDVLGVAVGLRYEAQQREAKKGAAADAMAALAAVAPTAVRDLFDSVDTDGNGSLDRDEVARFVRKLKATRFLGAEELDAVMAALDTDGDGSVTYEEFTAWWSAGGAVTASERLDDATAACGENLLGVCTALEEVRKWRSDATASLQAKAITEGCARVAGGGLPRLSSAA